MKRVNTAISEEQEDLSALIAVAERNITALQTELRTLDIELSSSAAERERYRALEDVCKSLDRLQELGAEALFWGEATAAGTKHLDAVRARLAQFSKTAERREEARQRLEARLRQESERLQALNEELAEQKQQEELRLDEFVVEREESELPFRPLVMPWSGQKEDENRFRKVLLSTLLVSLLFSYATHKWTLPGPDLDKPIEIPDRIARLVKPPEPLPEPPKPKEEEKTPEPDMEKPAQKPQDVKPTPAEKQQARKTAESSGVLAFKNSFADLIDNAPEAKLGVDARVSNAGQKAKGGQTQRALVTASARTGSGGIDTAALSRDVGSGRESLGGVAFSRVDSAIGTDVGSADRPLSDGPGPSRTDEEIQIVFDRYKTTLYRIYNMELRKDPTLQGKLVLRITIEPDGSVSLVKAESTDLASTELVDKILARVNRFNFGPKEGVPKVTILYPIDFLPAS